MHRIRRSPFLLSAIVVLTAFSVAVPSGAEDGGFEASTVEALTSLARTYEIEFIATTPTFPVKASYGVINGQRADRGTLNRYVRVFAPEFTLYPAEFVKRSKLKRVVICQKLSFDGQLRNAIPDWENDTLYLDAERGSSNALYLRKVIHHEFFHIIDYYDDGNIYQDERWKGLNPAAFNYGRGGRNVQQLAETSVLVDKFPGFLNHYSTTGVEEDKAEIFANLIVDPSHVAVRASKDPVLSAKVSHMKELLSAFCPQMNDAFWAKAGKLERRDQAPRRD